MDETMSVQSGFSDDQIQAADFSYSSVGAESFGVEATDSAYSDSVQIPRVSLKLFLGLFYVECIEYLECI